MDKVKLSVTSDNSGYIELFTDEEKLKEATMKALDEDVVEIWIKKRATVFRSSCNSETSEEHSSKEFTDIKCLRNAVLDELDADVRMVRVEKKAPSKVGLDEDKAISAKSIMEYRLGITQEDVERIISVPMSLFNILICLNYAITQGLDDKKMDKERYLAVSYGLVCAAEQIYSLLDENTKKEHEGCIKTLIISKEKLLRYYRNQH